MNVFLPAPASKKFPTAIKNAYPAPAHLASKLKDLEGAMVTSGMPLFDIEDLTRHHFSDGIYAREWTQPAGSVVVSKIHAMENFLTLMKGECLVSDGENCVHYKAPHMVKTMPGVKRAVYALTDVTIVTFHPNPDNETDMAKLEARFIIPEPPVQSPALESKP